MNEITRNFDSSLYFPHTVEECKAVGEGFHRRWQFPNCGGAIDGKHIRITYPAKTGAFYYNYKKVYSIVLMALLNLPPTEENRESMNFLFLGDEAFTLQKHILKPFSQSELTYQKRVFNYR
nr:unnamed protein product [Callosobruchus chinensis]